MSLKIAIAQINATVGDLAGNAARILDFAQRAQAQGADLVLTPELALCGYPPEDLLLRPRFLADCETALSEIAATTHGIVAVVGWPQSAGSVVYNAASVIRDGRIETTYRKRDLPNHAVFDERRYFEVDPDGGPSVFEVQGVPVGVVVCEDLWFPEPLAAPVAAGAQLDAALAVLAGVEEQAAHAPAAAGAGNNCCIRPCLWVLRAASW